MASKKTDTGTEPKKAAKKAALPRAKKAKRAEAAAFEARPEVVLPADPTPRSRASHDEVARRAYEIWLTRGGSAFENWVEAERQLDGD
ncbi:MAG: DUF2934 domain-containing protein [Deltaproteobacteria bacterium]|nr:DUF2934 domain-containing protein [Deltaproteobacteria bacterium]